MTAKEFLKGIKQDLETKIVFDESETQVTPIYENDHKAVTRVLRTVEGATEVIEITVRKLCVYEGLKTIGADVN
jgi:hypothetical protein